MKHMSKHAVVEHVVSHHSPHHRTDSPAIPIRISLIWALHASPALLFSVTSSLWSSDEPHSPLLGSKKNVPDCQYFVTRCSFIEYILLSFLADQTVLSGASKDDFSALSGLKITGLKFHFSMWLHRKKNAPGSYMENLFNLFFLCVSQIYLSFLYSPLLSLLFTK